MYKLDNTDGVKSHGLLIASVNSWLTNEAKPVQRRLRTKCTAVFIERETGVFGLFFRFYSSFRHIELIKLTTWERGYVESDSQDGSWRR